MHFTLLTLSLFTTLALSSPVEERTVTTYAVRNFTREASANNHVVTYNFVIDTGEERQPCTIIDETPVLPRKRTGELATTHPWYGKTCIQNDRWEASWGWDYVGDFTVLSLVHRPNRKVAFFGYKSPNTGLTPKKQYADVGPNPVQNA